MCETYLFSLGREPVNESLATLPLPPRVEEKAANERFLVGVFRLARRDIVLNQEVLFVRRVVTVPLLVGLKGESLAYATGLDSKFWF